MSQLAGAALSRFQKYDRLHHKDLVHIEGGLGSQILGAIIFWNLQETLGIEKAKCDLTYFSEQAQSKGLWQYELERFNLPISDFRPFERNSKRNLLRAKRDFLSDKELSSKYWEESRNKFKDKFQFNSEIIKTYFRNLIECNFDEPFAAIHIRRGDYLQVASRIVEFTEYIELINSIKKMLPHQILVISDSEVAAADQRDIKSSLEGHDVKFLDSPLIDSFNTHCLLREAEVLVTANSTYSFSAGLLGCAGQTVFSPMRFHNGVSLEKYNETFQAAGSFFIWPKRG